MANAQKNMTNNTIIFFISVIYFKLFAKIQQNNNAVFFEFVFYKHLNVKLLYITILFQILAIGAFAQDYFIDVQQNSALLLHAAGISEKEIQSLQLEDYPALSERVVEYYENHGYPFVSVSLSSFDDHGYVMRQRLTVDTGIFVRFDSIVLKGNVKLSKNFLYPYLGLKRNMPYSERVMSAVPQKIGSLAFATPIREAEISFVKDKAYLYLYLDAKRTNRFDGYIGLVPVDEQTGKVALNGELTLDLQNVLKQGEHLSLNWESSERYSQRLDVAVNFPYLFRSRFGVDAAFALDKVDTSYMTLHYHIGVPYAFTSNSYIQPYFDYNTSTILNSKLLDFTTDSGYVDYRKSFYGLKMRYRKLDYLFNPHKGLDLFADFSVGRRVIQKNGKVDASWYEGVDMQKTSYRLSGGAQVYIPIGRHFVVTPRVMAGSLLSGPHYYNELFKIGGVDCIRGFDVNDLYASSYLLYSAEVRYIFAQRSYVHLFFDGGTYEQQLENRYRKDSPFGFGAGIAIAVKAGLFYLDYALPRQKESPISFKTGKIHFGIKVEF